MTASIPKVVFLWLPIGKEEPLSYYVHTLNIREDSYWFCLVILEPITGRRVEYFGQHPWQSILIGKATGITWAATGLVYPPCLANKHMSRVHNQHFQVGKGLVFILLVKREWEGNHHKIVLNPFEYLKLHIADLFEMTRWWHIWKVSIRWGVHCIDNQIVGT